MLCALSLTKGTSSALTLRDVSTDSETFLQNLDALLTWVCEIEEITANQKPPSSEVKVVKAQLQEQKVRYQQHPITLFLVPYYARAEGLIYQKRICVMKIISSSSFEIVFLL